ncbi:MAG: hypothetical protein IJ809_04440 [Clostridia bacterium]|nr:hypothetical protein [Clostridia bacterium]
MKFKIIIFGICLFSILMGAIFSRYAHNKETIETNATALTNKTIVLDAGHGLPDRSVQVGYMEHQNNILIYKLFLKFKVYLSSQV